LEEPNLEELRSQYEVLKIGYGCALRTVETLVTNLYEKMRVTEGGCPFNGTKSRIKTFESVVEKCKRKGIPLEIDTIRDRITDIAGLRIICPFKNEIYKTRDALFNNLLGMSVVETKDYVAEPKENGYKSYHVVLSVPEKPAFVPVEIQIRSAYMDAWATCEHKLCYKNPDSTEEATATLKAAAEKIEEIEEIMEQLRKTKNPAN
jgi:putative GTP pyrophosphokinase